MQKFTNIPKTIVKASEQGKESAEQEENKKEN